MMMIIFDFYQANQITERSQCHTFLSPQPTLIKKLNIQRYLDDPKIHGIRFNNDPWHTFADTSHNTRRKCVVCKKRINTRCYLCDLPMCFSTNTACNIIFHTVAFQDWQAALITMKNNVSDIKRLISMIDRYRVQPSPIQSPFQLPSSNFFQPAATSNQQYSFQQQNWNTPPVRYHPQMIVYPQYHIPFSLPTTYHPHSTQSPSQLHQTNPPSNDLFRYMPEDYSLGGNTSSSEHEFSPLEESELFQPSTSPISKRIRARQKKN